MPGYTPIGKIGTHLGPSGPRTGWVQGADGIWRFDGIGVVGKDGAIRAATYSDSDADAGWALHGNGEADLPYRPEMVVDRVYTSGSVALGMGSYANIRQASLTIPAHWTTYDVEAYWAGYLADASGGSTGNAVTLTQMVHQGGNFDTGPIAHELEAQNNHDLNNIAGVDYVEGLGAVGTRLFTLQSLVNSGNATNFSRPRLIVRAYRTA